MRVKIRVMEPLDIFFTRLVTLRGWSCVEDTAEADVILADQYQVVPDLRREYPQLPIVYTNSWPQERQAAMEWTPYVIETSDSTAILDLIERAVTE